MSTVRLAEEEARKLGHSYVGTGMLLLAVVEVGGTASKILDGFGVTPHMVREEVVALMGRGSGSGHVELPYSENGKRVLEFALEEAEKRDLKNVAVLHLLLGLLNGKDTVAMRVFDVMGINLDEVRQRVLEELDKGYGPRAMAG